MPLEARTSAQASPFLTPTAKPRSISRSRNPSNSLWTKTGTSMVAYGGEKLNTLSLSAFLKIVSMTSAWPCVTASRAASQSSPIRVTGTPVLPLHNFQKSTRMPWRSPSGDRKA